MKNLLRSRGAASHRRNRFSLFIVLLALSAPSFVRAQSGKLEPIGWDASGRTFQLRLSAANDTRYRVDYSDDLQTWEFLAAIGQQQSPAEISDTLASGSGRRFYRALPMDEVVGESKRLGGGTVRSWVRLDAQGKPTALGATFSEAALTRLPSSGFELVLVLPNVPSVVPFNHIGLNWNPQGHGPPGVYNKAHFDVHFYMVSVQERNAINSSDGGTKIYRSPDPAFLPQDYDLSPGSGDARMGSHWWDLTAPELNGQLFTHTLIYGYYDGSLTFIEPMVTVALLKGKPALTADIKQPAAFSKAGVYPLRYQINHSAEFREYSISLEGITSRQASLAAPATQTQPRKSGLRLTVRDAWCGTSSGYQILQD
jgi:hypothetical protein